MTELNLKDYFTEQYQEFYEKIQNLFPVCLKCQKEVFLTNIVEDKILKIRIECPFCKNEEKLTLNDYIEKLQALIPEKKYCKEHKDLLCYGFCKDCDIWICKDCFIEHISENKEHEMYQSQFKIRPTCPEHPKEKASFYNIKENKYLCDKCDFKPILENLTNAYFYNLQDNHILSHCYRCLHYDFIITEGDKVFIKLDRLIFKIFENDNKLAAEYFDKIQKAFDLIKKHLKDVRNNNILIANSYLKSMPSYHIFKNIKNNMGENHTTFWGINNMIYSIEDKEKEKEMTKEVLLNFINKFIEICENNLTTGIHVKLSEENMLNFIEESDLRVKEIKSYKIDHDEVYHAYLLEKGKSFIIHGRNYFTVYDSNNFGKILDKNIEDESISYISPIGDKNFLVSYKQYYELYELKNEKYECIKNIKLEKVEDLEKFQKETGVVDKKKDHINKDISAICLLNDKTKIAIGQGSLITIREFETAKLIKTLIKHDGYIGVLFIFKNYLVSSCDWNILCFWNLDSFELEKQLKCGFKSPNGYTIVNDKYMVIGMDTFIEVLNLKKFKKCEVDYSGDFLMLDGMVNLNDNEVIIAITEYSTRSNNFYLLDLLNMEMDLHMKNVHDEIVEACVKIDDDRFVSVCRDCTFKVWEIKKGGNNDNYYDDSDSD